MKEVIFPWRKISVRVILDLVGELVKGIRSIWNEAQLVKRVVSSEGPKYLNCLSLLFSIKASSHIRDVSL